MQTADRPMGEQVVLLMDTCGEQGSVALAVGGEICAELELPERAASASSLKAIRTVLSQAKLTLPAVTGMGVVHGPGSFTGLRVGLAVAKGLCEALQVPLAAISRLAVLQHAGGAAGTTSILRAGRYEVYVREGTGSVAQEWMVRIDDLPVLLAGKRVLFAEASLTEAVRAAREALFFPLHASKAWPLVRRQLLAGGVDPASLDANYVRQEHTIYAKQQAAS